MSDELDQIKVGDTLPILPPEGYSPLVFAHAVQTVHTLWLRDGSFPTSSLLARNYSTLSVKKWEALIDTEQFRRALDYRGIPWDKHAGLSLEQQHVLIRLADPTDRRTIGKKLSEMGVPYARYQAWLKQDLFRKAMMQQAEDVLNDAVAPSLVALSSNAMAGDQRAIEKVLEISGRFVPNQQGIDDAKLVVQTLVEAILKHVPDPNTRQAIMNEVSLHAKALGAIRG